MQEGGKVGDYGGERKDEEDLCVEAVEVFVFLLQGDDEIFLFCGDVRSCFDKQGGESPGGEAAVGGEAWRGGNGGRRYTFFV